MPGHPREGSAIDSVDSFIRDVAEISEPASIRTGDAVPLETGEMVGDRFRIERRHGRGGMGSVYLSSDCATGLPAAVKVISTSGPGVSDRFAREGRLLAELSHPAIVRYIAQGSTPRGLPFLAMEWLEGVDLAERLVSSRLEVTDTVALMRRVCDALAVAHARGVVHRDIKPSNLFLVGGDPRAVKIIDFGIAHLETESTALTQPNALLGTVGYMAPEQALAAAGVDARADVFALGCVLFECLTGRPAFEGAPTVLFTRILRENPPRPSEVRPELGGAFDDLVGRMLFKDPAARPKDAAAVLGAIEALG
jgi:serine/threonine protein kinase